MRVAIIGGGAAGMITAHLLGGVHDVTVYERESELGGNIRTLGKNTDRGRVSESLCVDNGVIEFEPEAHPTFHRLLDRLGMETRRTPGSTGFYLADGRCFLSPGALRYDTTPLEKIWRYFSVLRFAPAGKRWYKEVTRRANDDKWLKEHTVGDCLSEGALRKWFRMLVMYAYSTPYAETEAYPARIGLPVLAHMTQTHG